MDGFLLLFDLAKGLYIAVDTAHGNKAQCRQIADRVRRIMAELQSLDAGHQHTFAVSATGAALTQTLQAAVALCEGFKKKKWLTRVFSSGDHAAQVAEIQARLDRVVADAHLGASLDEAARARAREQDAADARALVEQLREEQRSGFDNLKTGQGQLASMLDSGFGSMHAEVAALRSMMSRMARDKMSMAAASIKHLFEVQWAELVVEKMEDDDGDTIKVELGRGGFGVVFAGNFRTEPVALKQVSLDTPQAKTDFISECATLSRLHHPNVCGFFGAAWNDKNTMGRMAIERLHCSLVAAIHNPASVGRAPLDNVIRLRVTSEMAQGLTYLHTTHPIVVHHDLKPHNVMLTGRGVAKLIDFGLARVRRNSLASSTKISGMGTLQYMAPEKLQGRIGGGRKTDVYAFGMVVYELFAGEVPFADLDQFQLQKAVLAHKMPTLSPVRIPDQIAVVLRACWRYEAATRPDMATFTHLLATMATLSPGSGGSSTAALASLATQLSHVLDHDIPIYVPSGLRDAVVVEEDNTVKDRPAEKRSAVSTQSGGHLGLTRGSPTVIARTPAPDAAPTRAIAAARPIETASAAVTDANNPLVFISLCVDEARSEGKALQRGLHARGISTFTCDMPGQELDNTVVAALTNCKLVVILGTKAYGKRTTSRFGTLQELRYIFEVTKPFFLVKMCAEFEEAETCFRFSGDVCYFPWQPNSEAERKRLPPGLVDRVIRRLQVLTQGRSGHVAPPVATDSTKPASSGAPSRGITATAVNPGAVISDLEDDTYMSLTSIEARKESEAVRLGRVASVKVYAFQKAMEHLQNLFQDLPKSILEDALKTADCNVDRAVDEILSFKSTAKDKAKPRVAKDQDQDWLHGVISRETAESLLSAFGESNGLFLVRRSTSVEGAFVLSLCADRDKLHHIIYAGTDFYVCFDIRKPTLSDLIEYLSDFQKEAGWYTPLTQHVPRGASAHLVLSTSSNIRGRSSSVHTSRSSNAANS